MFYICIFVGDTVYSRIKAVDGVGHSSDIKSTNGVTIDTTPPVPISYSHNHNNLVMNPSFEETKGCLLDITIYLRIICVLMMTVINQYNGVKLAVLPRLVQT